MFDQFQKHAISILAIISSNPYIQAVIMVLASCLVAWVFKNIIIKAIRLLNQQKRFQFDNQFIELLQTPIYISILLIGIASSILLIHLETRYISFSISILQSIGIVIWSIFLLRFNRTLLISFSKNDQNIKIIHPKTLPLFLNITNLITVLLSVYILFSVWKIDMTAWLASAGIIGIAVGFAAKDTLANLFSGVFIMADAPYKIGDFIVLDSGERGEVTHIGIRSTRILTRSDVEITVPNSVMGNTKIINESGGPHEKHRCRIPIGVAYGSDIDKVRDILMSIAEAEEHVCKDPQYKVRFRVFGASSLDFELLVWIEKPVMRGTVIDKLNCAIYKKFIENNIEIPYSKQDIYIKQLPEREANKNN